MLLGRIYGTIEAKDVKHLLGTNREFADSRFTYETQDVYYLAMAPFIIDVRNTSSRNTGQTVEIVDIILEKVKYTDSETSINKKPLLICESTVLAGGKSSDASYEVLICSTDYDSIPVMRAAHTRSRSDRYRLRVAPGDYIDIELELDALMTGCYSFDLYLRVKHGRRTKAIKVGKGIHILKVEDLKWGKEAIEKYVLDVPRKVAVDDLEEDWESYYRMTSHDKSGCAEGRKVIVTGEINEGH